MTRKDADKTVETKPGAIPGEEAMVSIEQIRKISLDINPKLEIFEISCQNRTGLEPWFNWILQRVPKYKPSCPAGA